MLATTLTEGQALCWVLQGPDFIASPQHRVRKMMSVPCFIPGVAETLRG